MGLADFDPIAGQESKMKLLKFNSLVVLVFAGMGAQAQFAGNAFFSIAANTQAPGSVINNLVVANTGTGLVVTGTWQVTLPGGTYSGTLLDFEASRAMQVPTFGAMTTTTSVAAGDGIVQPLGNLTASGLCISTVDGAIGSSVSSWGFPNIGAGTFLYGGGFGLTDTSTVFLYPGGAGNFLKMHYLVDFNYSGAGGTYIFTFPLNADINPVPEPCTFVLLAGAIAFLKSRRRA